MESQSWRIEVFYDGQCPLCRREIDFLRRRDRGNQVRFTDITDPSFDASAYGKSFGDFMDRIQGRLPNGRWVVGVEVFRHLYSAVGFGFWVPLSRLPGISQLLDWAYDRFARNRLRWTGRCSADGGCELPSAAKG